MACRILKSEDGSAVFYCSSSMWAFGPVMESAEEAEAFAKWLHGDPRTHLENELENKYFEFRNLTATQKHEAGLCETLGIDYECALCKAERDAEDAKPFDARLSSFIASKVAS